MHNYVPEGTEEHELDYWSHSLLTQISRNWYAIAIYRATLSYEDAIAIAYQIQTSS
jgi:hypothetical protein